MWIRLYYFAKSSQLYKELQICLSTLYKSFSCGIWTHNIRYHKQITVALANNGFLLEETISGVNTTHAWVEIFINNLGWVAFDPSHKKCIDDKYIRISTGFDFEDASIIKGVKNNYNGDEFLDTKVDIENCQ